MKIAESCLDPSCKGRYCEGSFDEARARQFWSSAYETREAMRHRRAHEPALQPASPSESYVPPTQHPADHEPYWLFLRQVRHPADEEHEAVIDVFYCARCLGRQEVLDRVESTLSPDEKSRRRAGIMPALGSAVPRD